MFYHQPPEPDLELGARLVETFPRHRAFVEEFAKGGQIWMVGTFDDPMRTGSMGIFRSREAVEDFMAHDPFVVEGLVYETEVREWDPLTYPSNGP